MKLRVDLVIQNQSCFYFTKELKRAKVFYSLVSMATSGFGYFSELFISLEWLYFKLNLNLNLNYFQSKTLMETSVRFKKREKKPKCITR